MIVETVRKQIAAHDRPENKLDYQKFFKEKLKDRYGIKTSIIRKISNQTFREIKDHPKKEIFIYCEQLLESNDRYETSIAFEWALKLKGQYGLSDFTRFESWLKKHVNSWASCDHLCGGALGHLIFQFPELVTKTKKWTRSKNRWLRRASAVCLIISGRNRQLLDEILNTADILLTDEDDMVQKGYGWMLKEASNQFPEEIFEYVMKHKRDMPRTALRYSIEKIPPKMKKEAMKKDWQ